KSPTGTPSIVPTDQILFVDSGPITITAPVPLPTLSISDGATTAGAPVVEGNSGTRIMVFTVTTSDTTQDLEVGFTTADPASGNIAASGTDYQFTNGTLTFAPGDATMKITVKVNGDTTPETNEDFLVTLFDPCNATLSKGTGVGTIIDDDSG